MFEKNLGVIKLAKGNRYGYNKSGQSQREKLYMEDVMGALRMTSTKYQYYAMQCQNQELSQLCQHISQHQQGDLQQIQGLMGQRGGQLQ